MGQYFISPYSGDMKIILDINAHLFYTTFTFQQTCNDLLTR